MSTKNKIYTKQEVYQRLMEMDAHIILGPDFFKQAAEMIYHPKTPKMICLCGSLRFAEEFKKQELEHLMRGEIALMPCCMFTDIQREHGEDSEYKQRADARHRQLIDLADEVLVLNIDGYIGKSTKGEIAYAILSQKPVKYLVQPK